MYVTPADLIRGPDSLNELSELHQVASGLLRATITFQPREDWPEDEIVQADDALVSIQHACDQAGGEVEARLARRGYTLPVSTVQFPVLGVWARAIARYHLHPQRDRTNEETGRIERDYRSAIKSLELIAKGELSLGANDPLAVDAAEGAGGAVRVEGPARMFNRKSLGSL